MPRVNPLERNDVPDACRAIYEKMVSYGPFESQVGTMAHRPPMLNHVYSMLTELRDEGVLPRRYLELALVAVSKVNACEYCVSHHAPMLEVEGMTQAGVDRLLSFKDHPEMDDVDKLVVEYARDVSVNFNSTRDEIFDRLREHFSDAQIVELTWRSALCGAFNRFNDILQIDMEGGVEKRTI